MRINTGIFLKIQQYFNNFSSIWNKNILLKIRASSPKSTNNKCCHRKFSFSLAL